MKFINTFDKIAIYGAKSIALGIWCAIRELFPEKEVLGFLVSSGKDNPDRLGGLPVMEISDFEKQCVHKEEVLILIGTPETAHEAISRTLEEYGFLHYRGVDWRLEEEMMEQYYKRIRRFPSLRSLGCTWEEERTENKIRVFSVKSHRDVRIQKEYKEESWIDTLQAGAGQTDLKIAKYSDDSGEHISKKNGNYCELTGLYWIWKNVLAEESEDCAYYGMFQYRRHLDIRKKDVDRMTENQVDVVLPFPTVHEPDMKEHHERYIQESDWNAMLCALRELQPEYGTAFQELLRQPYLYNYNILIAKKSVLEDYCTWLFPILKRTEELSSPKGWERNDRYIGYLGENLLTLYFMYHTDRLRIVHTGRVMLT